MRVYASAAAVVTAGIALALVLEGPATGVTPERSDLRLPSDPTIAAVGDIACKNPPGNNRKVCQYDDVARVVEAGDYTRFLPLGDIQYENGGLRDFRENYDVYFGDLLPITEPVPGNHEYGTTDAAGYYRYFGDSARGPDGYYSYDLGEWHIVALNSAICPAVVGCGPDDPQYQWLQADLASHPNTCTLAYWHHPRFDWLKYQKADWTQDYEYLRTAPFWELAYEGGVDVVLSGHNHNYSRWLPMDAEGDFDPDNGITQFIVGTGGRNLNAFGGPQTRPATFVTGQSQEFGALELTLHEASYDFRFRSTLGDDSSYIDQGRDISCS
jgi:hypothetical protein